MGYKRLFYCSDFRYESNCSDFRYESNGIFVLGVGFCSDFRYESNGIFLLGVIFFLQTNFDFSTSHFSRIFLNIIRKPSLS